MALCAYGNTFSVKIQANCRQTFRLSLQKADTRDLIICAWHSHLDNMDEYVHRHSPSTPPPTEVKIMWAISRWLPQSLCA